MLVQLFVAVLVTMVVAMTDFSGYFLDEESEKLLYFNDDSDEGGEAAEGAARMYEESAPVEARTPVSASESAGEQERVQSKSARVAEMLSGTGHETGQEASAADQAAAMLSGMMPIVESASGKHSDDGEPVVVPEPDIDLDLDSIAGNFIEEVSGDVEGV